MNNRKNAYTEVFEILQDLDEEEFNKIPSDVIKAIEENRNLDYDCELDGNLELKNQTLLPQTKAILFNLFRDYLATPEQKEKIIKMQNEEREKIELKKKQMYNSEVFTDENSRVKKEEVEHSENEIKEEEDNNLNLVEYRPSVINRIWNYLQRILKKFKS